MTPRSQARAVIADQQKKNRNTVLLFFAPKSGVILQMLYNSYRFEIFKHGSLEVKGQTLSGFQDGPAM